jgi:hypothetical protein
MGLKAATREFFNRLADYLIRHTSEQIMGLPL